MAKIHLFQIVFIYSVIITVISAKDGQNINQIDIDPAKASTYLETTIKFYSDTVSVLDRAKSVAKIDPYELFYRETRQYNRKIIGIHKRIEDYLETLRKNGGDSEEDSEIFFNSIDTELHELNNDIEANGGKSFAEPSKELKELAKDRESIISSMEDLQRRSSIFNKSIKYLDKFGIHLNDTISITSSSSKETLENNKEGGQELPDTFDTSVLEWLAYAYQKLETFKDEEKTLKLAKDEIRIFLDENAVKLSQFVPVLDQVKRKARQFLTDLEQQSDRSGQKVMATATESFEMAHKLGEFLESAKIVREQIIKGLNPENPDRDEL